MAQPLFLTSYDNNGNLTKDLNKGISSISYNSLSLPQVVTFSNGNTITYLYAADGRKLRTVHVIGGVTTTTEYIGNLLYINNTPQKMLTEVGYMDLTDNTYYYYLKDHQDSEYANLLQFVDYLAPYQPTDFEHPKGVLGRQFVSSKDWIATNQSIKNGRFNF